MEQEPILHVWINHDNDLVDLTLTTTTAAQHGKAATKTSETIHTNKKHPFLTKEKGFLPVGQIKLGMYVLRADGTYGVVTGWKVVPGAEVMYNLEIAQDHTFTVGIEQWVVHNSDCGGTLANGTEVSIPEGRFNHSFGHAQDMLGRSTTVADRPMWRSLINQAMRSRYIFDSFSGASKTIGVYARVNFYGEMRPFVVQFFRDTGELATAYQPNADQLSAIFRILGFGR